MIASSVLTLYLALIGLSISGLFQGAIAALPATRRPIAIMALALLCGLLTNLLIFLAVRRLSDAMLIGAAVGVAAALAARWVRTRTSAGTDFGALGPCDSPARSWCLLTLTGGIIAALVMQLFDNVILEWDARSIWFFQGKMIYFSGGMFAEDFTLPGVQFGNMDYPKLIQILAGEVAFINGYWNEYQPLSALGTLISAEVLLIAYAAGTAWRFLIVVAVWSLLAGMLGRHGLLNGYADVHLAAFSLGAALCFQRWLAKSAVADAVIGLLTLGIIASLKNEGLVIALVIGLMALALGYRVGALQRLHTHLYMVSGAALLAAFPVLVWQAVKMAWQLKPDVLHKATWTGAAKRLNGADILEILRYLDILWPAVASGCVLAAHILLVRRRDNPAEFLFYCAAAYYLVLVLVYIVTPYDLKWHLDTSADRVVVAVRALLIGGIAAHLWSMGKWMMSREAVNS